MTPENSDIKAEQEYQASQEALAWMDHPAVKQLLERLSSLEANMEKFTTMIAPLEKQYKEQKDDFDKWQDEVAKEAARRRLAVNEAYNAVSEIKMQISQAKDIKNQLSNELNTTLQGLEAQKRLEEAEERWQHIMDENEWLWKEFIRPFQFVATKFMASAFDSDLHGVLNADQMGLGKTLMATASLDLVQSADNYDVEMLNRMRERGVEVGMNDTKSLYSVLWLCPKSITETTKQEIAKWSPGRHVAVLEGAVGVRNMIVQMAHANGLVLIANYEALRTTEQLSKLAWPVVVMDEAHVFKSDKAQVFKNVENVCQRAGLIYPMTGTPITNRPDEFWAILHMLTLQGKYKDKFRAKWNFINNYCYQWGNNLTFSGGGADRLIRDCKNLVIRRKKDEVELELPDKVRETRWLERTAEQDAVYCQMRDHLYVLADDESTDKAIWAQSVLALMTRLRQINVYPAGVKVNRPDGTQVVIECEESAKLDEAMEIIDELIANDEKVLVFSTFNDPLFALQKRIEEKLGIKTAAIVGGISPIAKAETIRQFNDPESDLKVVVGNIKAMGIGFNLHGACSHAIFLDKWWAPGVNEQAEDRLHRTGQKNAVTIHVLQCEDSIDKLIQAKLDMKDEMIKGVIDRQELKKWLEDGLI